MSNEFDVREEEPTELTAIRFGDDDDFDMTTATKLCRDSSEPLCGNDGYYVAIAEEECDVDLKRGSEYYVLIGSKEHAQNLMKALQKAIDLGWWG